jgi:hypothetical protein
VSKTKNESKDKYNENAYARYTVRIRKDSLLYDSVEEFMGKTGTSLNYLINKLLDEYFSNLYYKSYSD